METTPFQRVTDIRALSGQEWNRLVAEVERLMRIRGASPIGVTIDATGYHLTWDGRPAELLRVQSNDGTTISAGKLYPARTLRYLTLTQTVEEYLTAYLLAPNGEELTAGREHVGAYVADHTDGLPIYAMDCCTGGTDPASECEECGEDLPETWTLSLTGFGETVGPAGPCALFNHDWTLTAAGECTWRATGTHGQTVTLTRTDSGGPFALRLDYPGVLTLTYTGGTENCCDDQTLTFASVTQGTCDDHPDEVIAVPDCEENCEECDGATPDSWTMTASGFTNGKSCTCTTLNTDYTFERSEADDCTWVATPTGVTATLVKNASAPFWTLTLDLGGGCSVVYNGGTDDCCAEQTLDNADVADCATPPATLTLTPSCSPEPPPPCTPVCWTENYVDIQCIEGCLVRTVYEREVCMSVVNGCLKREATSWEGVSTTSQGVCDPSDPCEPGEIIVPPPESELVLQNCCPAGIPAVLSGTIEGVATTFTWDGTYWYSDVETIAMACGNRNIQVRWKCYERATGIWQPRIEISCNGGAFSSPTLVAVSSCDPFELVPGNLTNVCGPACQPPAGLDVEVFE